MGVESIRTIEAQLDETRGAEERRTVEVVAERLPIEAGIGIQHHPFRMPVCERGVPDGRDDLGTAQWLVAGHEVQRRQATTP